MLVPIYTFTDHEHHLKYLSKFEDDVDTEKLYYDQPHPEGHFGHYGKPWTRIYKQRKTEEKYYYPVIANVYDLSAAINKIIIPDEVLDDVKAKNAKILFISPFEGWEWEYWENIIISLRQKYNTITESDCVVITGNLVKHPRIKSVYFNFWENGYFFKNIPDYQMRGNDRIRSKDRRKRKFVFLNRRGSAERIGAVSLMYKHKDDGYLSLSKTGYYPGYYEQSETELQNKYEKLYAEYIKTRLASQLPLKVHDGIDVEIHTPVSDSKEEKFYDSYLHIVSETFMFNKNNRMFFSEKTFKPILYMQPFVLLGETSSLKNLRKLGYQTFPKYIDESYDREVDDQERIIKAINSAKEFMSMTDKNLHKTLVDMLPILNHNISNLQYRCMLHSEHNRVELLKHLKG